MTEPGQKRPATDEYFEYYGTYIGKVPDGDVVALAHAQLDELRAAFGGLTEAEAAKPYAPGKWTWKQLVGHLIDAERIFADRLHRFSSGDPQPQPGMDQDLYVAGHDYVTPTLAALLDELLHCRQANLLLVRRLPAATWDRRGQASGRPFTVRALVWILAGHIQHHLVLLRQVSRGAGA